MKDEWNIITPHHHCFWRDIESWPVLCAHEENSTYCAEDYCPIKRPLNKVVEDGQAKEWKCPECGATYVWKKPVKCECGGCKTPAT
ncbi:MAG: hypothetical protein GWN77_06000 [Gammaproteobacteria bacterium]|nr:hypothetical protein [Gammaproteobacteria bacterium]